MKIKLAIQNASASSQVPAKADVKHWAGAALEGRRKLARLSLRILDEAESAELNGRYRGKAGPTNVLSFPFESPPGLPDPQPFIGDLVICAPVVEREALEQGKSLEAHWAHMVVHGILHLLGHDHLDEVEAQEMEALETRILEELGFPAPYEA
ncbi:MAG: rRNA maturation RNase YbeY [Chromatiaceae bacterium]|nr:rRNA maturation RNase YbeY [Chromatiaceae bacterium]